MATPIVDSGMEVRESTWTGKTILAWVVQVGGYQSQVRIPDHGNVLRWVANSRLRVPVVPPPPEPTLFLMMEGPDGKVSF